MDASRYSLNLEQQQIAAQVNPRRTESDLWCEALACYCSVTRAEKGISVADFARSINVSVDDLLEFEMSHVCLCDSLVDIAKALGFLDLRSYFVAADAMLAEPIL